MIDAIPVSTSKNVFQGMVNCMVFCLHPKVRCYGYTGENEFQMLADLDYLAIGMGGEGPAIRIDEKLQYGKSYRSETYNNNVLTCKKGAMGHDFEVQDLEAYLF